MCNSCLEGGYEDFVVGTRHYDMGLYYTVLALCGEAGELANELKKSIRDDKVMPGGALTPERRRAIVEELGDVLWYVTATAQELGLTLNDVAAVNVAKLNKRRAENHSFTYKPVPCHVCAHSEDKHRVVSIGGWPRAKCDDCNTTEDNGIGWHIYTHVPYKAR